MAARGNQHLSIGLHVPVSDLPAVVHSQLPFLGERMTLVVSPMKRSAACCLLLEVGKGCGAEGRGPELASLLAFMPACSMRSKSARRNAVLEP